MWCYVNPGPGWSQSYPFSEHGKLVTRIPETQISTFGQMEVMRCQWLLGMLISWCGQLNLWRWHPEGLGAQQDARKVMRLMRQDWADASLKGPPMADFQISDDSSSIFKIPNVPMCYPMAQLISTSRKGDMWPLGKRTKRQPGCNRQMSRKVTPENNGWLAEAEA